VYKITNADGSCPLRSSQPLLALTPAVVTPDPIQGATVTFTASLHNATVPAGTIVHFQVDGANPQTAMGQTDANGNATFVETGINAGDDSIVAYVMAGSTPLTSDPALVTWSLGPHTTFLSLNGSPETAMAGRPVTLVANLTDVSAQPTAPISGALIQFNVDGQSCSASTGANGTASCLVTIPDVGAFTLTASYAGSGGSDLPATASQVMSTTAFSDLIFADGFDGD